MKQETKQVIINATMALLLVSMIAGVQLPETPIVHAQNNEVVATASPKALETITEVQNDTPESYIREVFGYEQGERAIQMLRNCENKTLKTDAINYNGNGSTDFGLFQINSIHGYTHAQLADYKFNTRIAYKIYKNAGYQFTPWTCAYEIGEVPFYLK